ncbi:MAG: hypothetical protein NUV90_01650 [Candidatus Parcubacteria bacterium]|nr:hypothetical protein [Candidatus Parcubacteria bacterium]
MRNIAARLSVCALILSIVAIFSVPSLTLSSGDIFFGGVKPLYHVRVAQFFYKRSAYPLFSKLPPRYAHHQLSRTYFIQGRLGSALDEAKKELEIYPDDTATYYLLGLTYGYMNREREAIDAFSAYIETHPGTWAGRNDKAWLQFRIGDIDGALQTIEPIADTFRDTAWVQNTYCALLMNKERFADAERACLYAKEAVDTMTEKDWGRAYPGNDPRVYGTGLQAMRDSIEQNLELIHKKLGAQVL